MDPYGANPLAEQARESHRGRFDEVSAVKAPPKMFAGGSADVPAFTASGIDPEHLLKLPAGIRHAAAANPDIVQLHRWFELYADVPEAQIPHEGLDEAKQRMKDWLEKTDTDPRTPEQRAADDDAAYQEYSRRLFNGRTEEEHKAKRVEDFKRKQDLARQLRELGRQ